MSELVSLAGKELLMAPRCPSPFYTPSGDTPLGIGPPTCPMSARGGPSCGSISNNATMDCFTPQPDSWQAGFVGAHVVRRSNLPPTNTSFATHTEKRWWEDGGQKATANGQGWLLQRADGDLYVTLGGTCGAFCSIAAAVGSYLREPHVQRRFGPLDSLAVLDIGGGTSSFDACISSVQGVGVTLALTPWEPDSDDTPVVTEYFQQTWISVERGSPLLLQTASQSRELPLQAGSFHAVFSCRTAGGGLLPLPWYWLEVQRILKPGGYFFVEPAPRAVNSIPNTSRFCMVRENVTEAITTRYYVRPNWKTYPLRMHIYRRLPLKECTLADVPVCRTATDGEAVETCVTPDHSQKHDDVDAASIRGDRWEELVEAMTPWLRGASREEMAALREQDERNVFRPPAHLRHPLEPTLSLFTDKFPANSSRAVTVLSVEAVDDGFSRALRARAPSLWGILPGGVHTMSTTRHRHLVAPPGAVVHDLCARTLPVHPRAYDIIVLHNATALARHCASSRRGLMGVAALRHAALEVLRLSRPAHLGLIILSGDAELEAHTRDYLGGGGASAADKDLCEALATLNVTFLGCVGRAAGRACVLKYS